MTGIDGREPAQVASMQNARDRYGYEFLPPERTVCVGDASGAYQDAKHNPEDPPSWVNLRGAGYRVVYPDPDEQRNPDVVARFSRANHLLRHAPHQGIERRVFFLAEAVRAIETARKLPTHSDGTPKRRSKGASTLTSRTAGATWRGAAGGATTWCRPSSLTCTRPCRYRTGRASWRGIGDCARRGASLPGHYRLNFARP